MASERDRKMAELTPAHQRIVKSWEATHPELREKDPRKALDWILDKVAKKRQEKIKEQLARYKKFRRK